MIVFSDFIDRFTDDQKADLLFRLKARLAQYVGRTIDDDLKWEMTKAIAREILATDE